MDLGSETIYSIHIWTTTELIYHLRAEGAVVLGRGAGPQVDHEGSNEGNEEEEAKDAHDHNGPERGLSQWEWQECLDRAVSKGNQPAKGRPRQ